MAKVQERVSVRLPAEMVNDLKERAKLSHSSVSEVLRAQLMAAPTESSKRVEEALQQLLKHSEDGAGKGPERLETLERAITEIVIPSIDALAAKIESLERDLLTEQRQTAEILLRNLLPEEHQDAISDWLKQARAPRT
ncbi:MAG: ribbon-helix-helix protein, CopG family [bacterium]|nr:ribbon-helix-helix protein, CopG family [bacterium]